jgi:hypothetical protein
LSGHIAISAGCRGLLHFHWVLSSPYKLKFQMAHNPKLTNKILSIYMQSICSYQKKKAKKFGIKSAKSGSVTFIQRFGSALNLNVHFHSLFAAGQDWCF